MVNPTLEQQEAIKLAQEGKSLRLIAFAGAGKTATLKLIAQALAPKKGLYMAFNKSIAQEAQSKMPSSVTAKTFHSQALSVCPMSLKQRMNKEALNIKDEAKEIGITEDNFPPIVSYVGAVRIVDENETDISEADSKAGVIINHERAKQIVSDEEGLGLSKKYREDAVGRYYRLSPLKTFHIMQLVRECLVAFLGSCEEDTSLEFVAKFLRDRYLIPLDAHKHANDVRELQVALWKATSNLINHYLQTNHGVPNTIFHSLYLKLWQLSKPILDYDFILYDEAQDADPLMIDILQNQIDNGVQVIIVGDPHQQIYEWRGAVNAMQRMDLPSVYLTKSFRFGEEIAKRADSVLKTLLKEENTLSSGRDDIESKIVWLSHALCDVQDGENQRMAEEIIRQDNRNQGVTEYEPSDHDIDVILKHTGAILCLTNMSCFEHAMICRRSNIAYRLMTDTKEMTRILEDVNSLSKGKTVNSKLFRENNIVDWDSLKQYVEESIITSPELAGAVRLIEKYSFSELKDAVENNANDPSAITICTVHKSKGLEWETVMFADDIAKAMLEEMYKMICQSKMTKTELFRTYYVAITRPQRVSIMSAKHKFVIDLIEGRIHQEAFREGWTDYLERKDENRKLAKKNIKNSRQQRAKDSMKQVNERQWLFGKVDLS